MLLYAGKRNFTKQPLERRGADPRGRLARGGAGGARSAPITFDIPAEAIVVDADSTQLCQRC